MLFDTTRVVVRERSYPELLDLALCFFRAHAAAIFIVSLTMMAPLAALNYWLLHDYLLWIELFDSGSESASYVWRLVLLTWLELPLATAPLTLYLGQAMFLPRPQPRRIVLDFLKLLPQLFTLRIALPAVLILLAVFVEEEGIVVLVFMLIMIETLVRYLAWPYLSEIILLEQNPLWRKSGRTQLTTLTRSKEMHSPHTGTSFARWLAASAFGVVWVVALAVAFSTLHKLMTGDDGPGQIFFALYLPAALWIVFTVFAVVRFLSYLDMRIRSEGWELELKLRAEADRMTRRIA